MSKRTLHILSLARTKNMENYEEKIENNSCASSPLDTLDIGEAPIIFLPEDVNLFSFQENTVNFDFQGFLSEDENKGCDLEDKSNIPNSKNCCDNNGVTNTSCDEYFELSETIPDPAKNPQMKHRLVPYECFSDEDEGSGESDQLVCEPLTTGSSFDKDKTFEPSAVSSSSQDSYEGDIFSYSEDTELEDAQNNIDSARKRKKVADESEWVRIKNKRLRMQGKAYLGFSKKRGEKIKQNQPREARTLKKTCDSTKCIKTKLRYCKEFTETCRQQIFNKFWSLSWDQRKVVVASHVLK
ncbi:unnamed protein product, partial [Callosobruchus maculatus]